MEKRSLHNGNGVESMTKNSEDFCLLSFKRTDKQQISSRFVIIASPVLNYGDLYDDTKSFSKF